MVVVYFTVANCKYLQGTASLSVQVRLCRGVLGARHGPGSERSGFSVNALLFFLCVYLSTCLSTRPPALIPSPVARATDRWCPGPQSKWMEP